ncbi:hypothetical protein RDI58_019311 [Solanum bulbocastanum]|uniref:Uncharacterized protein n=1 Tax=Solanum bulbocastanum TaxID=147425 RepID=A0AAN8T6H2_SOLBU
MENREEVPFNVTRELLIAISNLLPDIVIVETSCISNGSIMASGDRTEDFRTQLMSISSTQSSEAVVVMSFAIGIFAIYCLLKRANDLFHTSKFSSKEYNIPPGDMSLPFIGNMFTFFTTFKYGAPDSFISYFTSRYGQGGMYKAFMFGTPSIIVTKPQVCKKILMDDDNFELGWPKSVLNLIGKKALHGITSQEHKRLRRITTSPIKGKHALSLYLGLIEEVVKSSFEKWNVIEEKPIKFLSEMKKSTFEVIIRIMIGSEIDPQWLDMVEKVYTIYLKGFLALPINLPGFAYHRAFKEEQEEIVKRRLPDSDKKLSYDEIRQMKYLTKVIDETLRCSNVTLAIYRNAKRTINMNGYTIPKGWKVLTWIRQVNLDPNNHVNPKEFNPSRWDDDEAKTFSVFLPFGAGPRLCPGAELAKLEVSVFLHYFLLNYRLERLNPKTSVTYLPIPSPTDNCLARLKRISSSCQ